MTTETNTEHFYVVVSFGRPSKIYFNQAQAFTSGVEFVEAFNSYGDPVRSYRLIDGKYQAYGVRK